MRNLKFAGIAALAMMAVAGYANIYSDATGDEGPTSGPAGGHIDITQVEVTNDATSISFAFTVAGDLVGTNWGKYNVIIRNLSNANLDMATPNNPWGRSYELAGGSNAFIGSWVDAPTDNQQNWTYNGASWDLNSTVTNVVTGTNMVTLTSSLSDLGLSAGDILIFDAVTTANGTTDTAIDSLTGATPADWGSMVDLQGMTYQVNAVPEPVSMVMLGLGAAALLRRKRKA